MTGSSTHVQPLQLSDQQRAQTVSTTIAFGWSWSIFQDQTSQKLMLGWSQHVRELLLENKSPIVWSNQRESVSSEWQRSAPLWEILRRGCRVHLPRHLQPVEALHVGDGSGQDLRRLHGGHLSAHLGQVAKLTEPRLQEDRRRLRLEDEATTAGEVFHWEDPTSIRGVKERDERIQPDGSH